MFLQVRGHIYLVSVSGSLHNDSTFKPSIAHQVVHGFRTSLTSSAEPGRGSVTGSVIALARTPGHAA